MKTKPRATKRTRNHIGSLCRSIAWEWTKAHNRSLAAAIKAVAYRECGLEPPKPANFVDAEMMALLNQVSSELTPSAQEVRDQVDELKRKAERQPA